MIKHYAITTFRSFKNNKLQLLISLLGLSVGISFFLLGVYWLWYETHYDSEQQNIEQTYKIVKYSDTYISTGFNKSFPDELKKNSDIELITQKREIKSVVQKRNETERFTFNGCAVDKNYFTFFDLCFKENSQKELFEITEEIILTEKMAKSIFGSISVVGETLLIDGENYKVAGVVSDRPVHSLEQFEFLIPIKENDYNMGSWMYETYIVLNKHSDADAFAKTWKSEGLLFHGVDMKLDIVPYMRAKYQLKNNSFIEAYSSLLVILLASFLILVSTVFNFIILTTARFLTRLKEFNLRRSMGAKRSQVIMMLLGEILLLLFISLWLTLIEIELLRKSFFAIANIDQDYWGFKAVFMQCILFCVCLIMVAALYPVLYSERWVTSNSVRQISKGKMQLSILGVQLVIGSAFLLCIGVFILQFRYLAKSDMGFEKENIIRIQIDDTNVRNNFQAFEKDLAGNPFIEDYCPLGNIDLFGEMTASTRKGDWLTLQDEITFSPDLELIIKSIQPNSIPFFDVEFVAGRNFDNQKDQNDPIILNEEAVKRLGLTDNPVGKIFFCGGEEQEQVEVVGVIKNFHSQPLSEPIFPTIYFNYERRLNKRRNFDRFEHQLYYVKYEKKREKEVIQYIRNSYQKISGKKMEIPVILTLEEHVKNFYTTEESSMCIFGFIALFSILMIVLGVYALTVFSVRVRCKEIAIRKILGATTGMVVETFSRGYVILIVVSSAVAIPFTCYWMNKWLEGYAYRIHISVTLIAIVIALIAVTVLLTVLVQVLKAVKENSVDVIKNG